MKDIILYITITILLIFFIFICLYSYTNLYKNVKNENYELHNDVKINKDDDSLLHITPAKLCTGGAFLNDIDLCKDITEDEKNCVSCNRIDGLIGRPVHFEFTPLSDNNWKNKRCSTINKRAKCSNINMMPATL